MAAPASYIPTADVISEEIEAIKSKYETEGKAPVDQAVAALCVDDSEGYVNKYQYKSKGKTWSYIGTFGPDDVKVKPEPKKKAEKKVAVVMDELVEELESEKSEIEAEKPAAKAEKKPKAKKGEQKAAESSSESDDVVSDAKPKKARKQRVSKMVSTFDFAAMSEILEKMVLSADEPENIKSLVAKANELIDKATSDKPKKKLSEYNLYVQSEMLKLSTTQPELAPNQRLKAVMAMWKEHKATQMATSAK